MSKIKIRKIKKGEYTEWVRGKSRHDSLVCENPKFARVEALMVSELKVWHDEIMFIESPVNVIVVPVYKSKEIYLHEEYRPKVMKPRIEIKPRQLDKLKLSSLGDWSLEVPRGVSEIKDKSSWETAKRELKEETGLESIKEFKPIGKIDTNTAYVVARTPVFIAVCDDKKINEKVIKKEEKEKIKDGNFYTIGGIKNMIKNKRIFCGVTLAALNLVFLRLEEDDRDGLIETPRKASNLSLKL